MRALESGVFVVLLKQNKIKTNCYSSLPYLRPAYLCRASLCFLPGDSLGLIHQGGGLGLSAAALTPPPSAHAPGGGLWGSGCQQREHRNGAERQA